MEIIDKFGFKKNNISFENIVAIHKFSKNDFENYDFNHSGITKNIFGKIEYINSCKKIFEVFYFNNQNLEKYFLVMKDIDLKKNQNKYLFNKFETITENKKLDGELYVNNKIIQLGYNKKNKEKIYLFKEISIIQFASKNENYDGIEKFIFNIKD